MNERFLKFIPSQEAFWLMHEKPNAFRLLAHIANTARRYDGHPDGRRIGECHLQHWKNYGLTERQYRTAKEDLCKLKILEIVETNRTRQKSTTGTTTKSTLVRLLDSRIWDINPETKDDRNDDRATTERRLNDDKQERIRNTSSNEEVKYARSPKAPRTNDDLSFDFENWQFIGITDKDKIEWLAIYTHINLEAEIGKAAQWLKSNPSKSKKSLWRKYLTGWLQRANDWSENKKAFSYASGNTTDRRTKDINGVPVENAYAGRF